MKTYQDLLNATDIAKFVLNAIADHKQSDGYKIACIANEYAEHRNVTISEYQKLLYTVSGKAVPDNYSADHKLKSNFFDEFVTQEVQYLLGNGTNWTDKATADKMGEDFDTRLQNVATNALIAGVAFGFWDNNHLVAFKLTEFVPLWDEDDSKLKAGIRFWRLADNKPLHATLYELDGYTDFMWKLENEQPSIEQKHTYKQIVTSSVVDGVQVFDFENYSGFPIVPMWGNSKHQSELIGRREQIDSYDLVKSGFANDLDDVSQIYWIIQNAGGMDDIDLAKFLDRLRTVKAAVVEDNGARAESHTIDVPYASREALLDRLRNDLYDDFMAFDPKQIANGATTATQIQAAYEPLDLKSNKFEYQILDFIQEILKLAGIDDAPTFTRSRIVNKTEEIQVILQAATYLPQEYVTQKIVTILGDVDQLDEIMAQTQAEDIERFPVGNEEIPEEEE